MPLWVRTYYSQKGKPRRRLIYSRAPVLQQQSLSGTLATSGSLVIKVTTAAYTGTLASSGTLTPTTVKISRAGTLATAGANTYKVTTAAYAGELVTEGAVANTKISYLAAAGTLATSGANTYKVTLPLSGTLVTAGALTLKVTTAAYTGTLATTATLTASLLQQISVGGTLATEGTLQQDVSHNLAGTLATSGALTNVEIPGEGEEEEEEVAAHGGGGGGRQRAGRGRVYRILVDADPIRLHVAFKGDGEFRPRPLREYVPKPLPDTQELLEAVADILRNPTVPAPPKPAPRVPAAHAVTGEAEVVYIVMEGRGIHVSGKQRERIRKSDAMIIGIG